MATLETCDPNKGDKRKYVKDVSEIPHSAVAHLVIDFRVQQRVGTGFLSKVDGHFIIVTAAHNLYDHTDGKAHTVYIFLGRDVERYHGGIITKLDVHLAVPDEYIIGEDGYDFGIIFLDKSENDVQSPHHFTLCPTTDQKLYASTIHMSGYPGDQQSVRQMKIMLTEKGVKAMYIYYKDATSVGNSGSPLYIKEDQQTLAIGIHTNGFSKDNT